MIEAIVVFIFGLLIGSFLNVCIARFPQNQSIIRPRSFCPHCKKTIHWYDNIPVLSYLFLKRRCRFCKKRISIIYPLVELITAFVFLFLYDQFGLNLVLFKYSVLFFLLIVVSSIDIKYHAIPAYLCILGIVTALFFSGVYTLEAFRKGSFGLNSLPLFHTLKGLIFGLGFSYLFKLFGDFFIGIYLTLCKKESIEGETESLGLGDVDFMGMIGAFLGVKAVILVFFLAPFVALVYTIFALIFKKSHLIPYLPYLSIATFIVFVWGNDIWNFIL
ncbi:MAG: prepilin peptidase [Candidatus Omnitrophica bacterium]|nr:prepilin peptidase [Candidatus Omnitrophota bacterium]MCF7895096.1 prepilin peptidase [Candidatus Omnitrophota bacterium]